MYYKTKRTSETGVKFKNIEDKMVLAYKEAKEFALKYKFKQWRGAHWCVSGGISSCIDFKNNPDSKLWGKGAREGEYFPKRNSNAGKAICEEIKSLTKVTRAELNQVIGFNEGVFKTIGFSRNNPLYFGFEIGPEWNLSIPKDCEEITFSQYRELFK